tara:strand:+ start:48 stop:302 length:255 start_codon:yes stop_codon:yes gene_type:complete
MFAGFTKLKAFAATVRLSVRVSFDGVLTDLFDDNFVASRTSSCSTIATRDTALASTMLGFGAARAAPSVVPTFIISTTVHVPRL